MDTDTLAKLADEYVRMIGLYASPKAADEAKVYIDGFIAFAGKNAGKLDQMG